MIHICISLSAFLPNPESASADSSSPIQQAIDHFIDTCTAQDIPVDSIPPDVPLSPDLRTLCKLKYWMSQADELSKDCSHEMAVAVAKVGEQVHALYQEYEILEGPTLLALKPHIIDAIIMASNPEKDIWYINRTIVSNRNEISTLSPSFKDGDLTLVARDRRIFSVIGGDLEKGRTTPLPMCFSDTVTTPLDPIPGLERGRISWVRLPPVRDVKMRDGSIFVLTERGLFAWGRNRHADMPPSAGRLGVGSSEKIVSRPARVRIPSAALNVMAISDGTFFQTVEGVFYASGDNSNGRLGIGSFMSTSIPVMTVCEAPIRSLVFAPSGLFALTARGIMSCGNNRFGTLGVGSARVSTLTHLQIPGEFSPNKVICGRRSTFLIQGQDCYAMGLNGDGQLGVVGPEVVHVPTRLRFPVTAVLSVGNSSVFVSQANVLVCGEILRKILTPVGTRIQPPSPIAIPWRFTSLVLGWMSLFVLAEDGTWHACGLNHQGQLGSGMADAHIRCWRPVVTREPIRTVEMFGEARLDPFGKPVQSAMGCVTRFITVNDSVLVSGLVDGEAVPTPRLAPLGLDWGRLVSARWDVGS
ncbi:regulator of chromosome condensation (RCC1) repeat family protein [Carpediemonas membranifera]|uniref:Regulator of chromosome condensation (RCC1) repeat family protein n=1 Tax=Carpediemonas membranifera TaxID=201153 RepID=A0A8J6BH28_9EUKA|nr:regulator of chromosome condensation (RCC1) repeat family protein [Carpediemonas membranifera]|eukprot:KAG9397317.1 regulator of chromosome condensation (RCC1) repeat family protein [Carpediemonas membranifera]